MFKIGSAIVHSGMGICTVSEITKMKIGNNPAKDFYVLKPVYENSSTKIFVPVENSGTLREPLNADSIKKILNNVNNTQSLWIPNDVLRKNEFNAILKSGDHTKIIKLICELHEQKNQKEQNGKKLHLSDEKVLREAERLIHGELAYSMNIEPENVAEYIMNELL